jgi:hypothetical protein
VAVVVVVATATLVTTSPFAAGTAGADALDRDPSWNGGQPVRFGDQASPQLAEGMAVAGDGSVYVVSTPSPGPSVVRRLTPSGSADNGYGTGGTAALGGLDPMFAGAGPDVAVVQPSTGDLLVTGRTAIGNEGSVTKLDATGTTDASFATAGRFDVASAAGVSTASIPAIAPWSADGRTVVAYTGARADGSAIIGALRIDATGGVDPAFEPLVVELGTGELGTGELETPVLDVDPTGRGVVGVSGRVVRTTAAGGLDSTFQFGGLFRRGCDLAADALARLLVACSPTPTVGGPAPTAEHVELRRYGSSGALDPSYGDRGVTGVPASPGAAGGPASPGIVQSIAATVSVVGSEVIVGGGAAATYDRQFPDLAATWWRFSDTGTLRRAQTVVDGLSQSDSVVATHVSEGGRITALVQTREGSLNTAQQAAVVRYQPVADPVTQSVGLASPKRLVDTRSGLGAPAQPIGRGATLTVTVRGTDVPADARAVALNITAVDPQEAGFMVVGTCDRLLPVTSNVNFGPGQTTANLAITPIGTDGTVCIYSTSRADVVVDLVSVYASDADIVIPPAQRLLDTRLAGDRVVGDLEVPLGSAGGSAAVRSVLVNVTVTDPAAAGWVRIRACDEPSTGTSNINFVPGQTVANLAAVRVSADEGRLCAFSNVPTHLVIDLLGMTGAGSSHLGPRAERVLDTRDGTGVAAGRLAAGQVLHLSGPAVPAGAYARFVNVTVTEPEAAGFVTVWPCSASVPGTSTVNFRAGDTRANSTIVNLAADGSMCVYTSVSTHLVIDLQESYVAR